MMVLHADGDNSFAVSFPRDLWVDVPGHGKEKINAAFNDGPQKVIDTLKADFDLDINHYLEVNFKTFEDIVNAVGSVPVYFPYPARDQLSGLGPTWVGGCYQLDGPNALAYVRSRYLEYKINGVWQNASPEPTSTAFSASRTSSRSSAASPSSTRSTIHSSHATSPIR